MADTDEKLPLADSLRARAETCGLNGRWSTAALLLEAAEEIERLRECVNIVANESNVAGEGDRVIVSLPSADYRHVLMVGIDER